MRSSSKRSLSRAIPRPREQFVQANYRFVVDGTDDSVRSCINYANAIVAWDAIDVVFIPHQANCPICLYPSRCPRVTPCGHVFDAVCILQYIAYALAENKLPRCPICADRLQPDLLKPCVFTEAEAPSVGRNITLQLVSRRRQSMLCHPHKNPPYTDIVPILCSPNSRFYSRISFACRSTLIYFLTCFRNELSAVAYETSALSPFVNNAINYLENWAKIVHTRPSSFPSTPFISPLSNIDTNGCKCLPGCSKLAKLKVKNNLCPTDMIAAKKDRTPLAKQKESVNHSHDCGNVKERWYFYQEEASSNVFLHPVNHRMLSTEYDDNFDLAIRRLEGTILQVDEYTMDESLRRRYRFLDHLPDGCAFMFVELDLSQVVSHRTLVLHKDKIEERSLARETRLAPHAEESQFENDFSNLLSKSYRSDEERLVNRIQGMPGDKKYLDSFPALGDDAFSNNFE